MSNRDKQIDLILQNLKAKNKCNKEEELFISYAENQDRLNNLDKSRFNKLIKVEWCKFQLQNAVGDLKEFDSKEKAQKRKQRNQKLILSGLVLEGLIKHGYVSNNQVRQMANTVLTRKGDRAVFNLPPLSNESRG